MFIYVIHNFDVLKHTLIFVFTQNYTSQIIHLSLCTAFVDSFYVKSNTQQN